MAVLHRHQPPLSLPPDFGLGVMVTVVFGILLLVLCLGVGSSGMGPRGEARQPDSGGYVDIQPPTSTTGMPDTAMPNQR
jgi:hypothetical protein